MCVLAYVLLASLLPFVTICQYRPLYGISVCYNYMQVLFTRIHTILSTQKI